MRFWPPWRWTAVRLGTAEELEPPVPWLNVHAGPEGGPYTCPCCGHPTLDERGMYDLCRECDWEDDGQDDHDSDVVRGGPNGLLSLDDARAAYLEGGGHRGHHVAPADPR